jgi:hypothetical protein
MFRPAFMKATPGQKNLKSYYKLFSWEQIETVVPRVKQVMRQTRARIFRGDTRSEGKIFSIFEPSTEIIRKGKAGKPNEFGKVVKIQESENQIVGFKRLPMICAHNSKFG